ncbi:MAG: DUF3021 domain-containing protein [Clostridia bacterium]|nr:DUF3021 domain-containing protein [Clostridia bacterium]
MNKYVKNYLQRGIAFGGFGPIITGIVFWILQLCGVEVILNGAEVLVAILSTYVLAFVQAGSSVFNQVEGWPIAKSMGIHFASLYVVYVGCYLVNRWIPFAWEVVAIFTGIFAAVYLIVWLTVYLIVRNISKKLNKNIA